MSVSMGTAFIEKTKSIPKESFLKRKNSKMSPRLIGESSRRSSEEQKEMERRSGLTGLSSGQRSTVRKRLLVKHGCMGELKEKDTAEEHEDRGTSGWSTKQVLMGHRRNLLEGELHKHQTWIKDGSRTHFSGGFYFPTE